MRAAFSFSRRPLWLPGFFPVPFPFSMEMLCMSDIELIDSVASC
jgi:hypothetical protein